MTDRNKQVKNQLFNNAVTGSTFEDFSQNAILLPFKTPPPPPVDVTQVTEQSAPFDGATNFFQPSQHDSFPNEPPFDLNQTQQWNQPQQFVQPNQLSNDQVNLIPEPRQEQSNLSSVFSSFSNFLNLKGDSSPAQPVEEFVPPPAGIGELINQEPTVVNPVPLFAPDINISANKIPPPQGPVNTFRRPGLKRPVYAPVPGLSNPVNNPQTSEAYLKPVSPQPPPFFVPQVEQPIQNIPNQHYIQSPVMAAISPNEHNPDNVLDETQSSESGMNAVSNQPYRPVYQHWFHRKEIEGKTIWEPFSMVDSLALEQAFVSNDLDPDKVVATDGGRYDVNILRRQRIPVYWKGQPNEVRRCSWFYKGTSNSRYLPYEENIASKLEEEYKQAFEANRWHRKVELPNGETVMFHAADVLALFPPTPAPDAWGNSQNQPRPRVVKRGMDEFDIDDGEPAQIDHLLFLVHGIGSVCDLKFRTVEQVVDDFRSIALQLVQSHYKSSCENGLAHRVEVLPISWHEELHSEDTGIDKKMKSITLESIPKLRDFTNDTLLDIFFYTSPVYCQTIISTVGNQLNQVYDLFKRRNPQFKGGVSLGGHSLGSLILFDLLCHQKTSDEEIPEEDPKGTTVPAPAPLERRMSRRISYMMSNIGTGQPHINYPHLDFHPRTLFALGSPIGMFVTVRGLDTLGEQFSLPTCPAFFNIFHPYDPVAYRIESLINPDLATLKPVLIPHHKGRKRMHLELKETMARVGADLKQRVIDSMKSTWHSFYQLAMFHRQDQPSLEDEVNNVFSEQLEKADEVVEEPEQQETDLPLGALNNHRRIDYILQEAPFEFINDYIFALTSHVCYWDSEDTMLLMLKEIYSNMNISPDDKIPQQTMSIERTVPVSPYPTPSLLPNNANNSFVGPTVPLQQTTANLGPPPVTGFVKKT